MTTPTPEDGCKAEEVSADQMEIRRLRHEVEGLTIAGVVECMARNPAVFERISELERELATAKEWREAVLNELIVAHIYTKEHDTNPRKAVQDAIIWNCQVALDPLVSPDARALIAQAEAERDALRRDAERWRTCLDSVGVAVSIFNVDPAGWRYPESEHLVAAIDNIIEGNENAWKVPVDTGGAPLRAPFELNAQSRESVEARFYRYLRDESGGNEDNDGPMICAGLGDQFDFLRGEECDKAIRQAIDARAAIDAAMKEPK